MEQCIGGRIPSRRVLDELRLIVNLPKADDAASPVARAFVDLEAALAAHAEALTDLDRAEAALIAARKGMEVVGAIPPGEPQDSDVGVESVSPHPRRAPRRTSERAASWSEPRVQAESFGSP